MFDMTNDIITDVTTVWRFKVTDFINNNCVHIKQLTVAVDAYVLGRDGGQAGIQHVWSVPAWCRRQHSCILASSSVQPGTHSRVSTCTALWRLRVKNEEENCRVPHWQGRNTSSHLYFHYCDQLAKCFNQTVLSLLTLVSLCHPCSFGKLQNSVLGFMDCCFM